MLSKNFQMLLDVILRNNITFNLNTALVQPSAAVRNKPSLSQRFYSSHSSVIGIVDYEVVKKIPNHPEKLLIDVREPEELTETGQIPGSINIPLGVIGEELGPGESPATFKAKYGREKPKPDTEIIFHCKIGKRSLKAAETSTTLGYKNVKNYEGSWLDWAEREGLPK